MRRSVIFEEHAAVLPHWFAGGLAGATLICLDTHLDLQFVDEARLARLRRCVNAAELGRLQSPHPMSPDRSFCFGIEDFLLPAVRLGMIGRVVWVAPPPICRAGMAVAVRELQQMEGVTIEDLESFRRAPGGWLQGRLLGVELTVCELPQLQLMDLTGPVVADIDADYFVTVPGDSLWTTPGEVIRALKELPAIGCELTISRSVGTGFMPLRHGFIADELAALWEDRPSGAQQSGWSDCRGPAAPGDVVRRLGEFRARHCPIDPVTVAGLGREVKALDCDDAQQAVAWASLGHLFAALGRVEEAMHCDAKSMSGGAGHPELALEIARLWMARGRTDLAETFLCRAAGDDETRVIAWLHLAECAWARGDPAQAIQHAQAARRAAPAWPLPLKRLAAFARAALDAGEASRLQREHEELQARLQAVARGLSLALPATVHQVDSILATGSSPAA